MKENLRAGSSLPDLFGGIQWKSLDARFGGHKRRLSGTHWRGGAPRRLDQADDRRGPKSSFPAHFQNADDTCRQCLLKQKGDTVMDRNPLIFLVELRGVEPLTS